MQPLIFCLVAVSAFGLSAGQKFDRNAIGVAFSPYVDPLPGRLWNEYSVDDIKKMLGVVSNFFRHISTYSMGTASYNNGNSWDKCDSNSLVARAAAQLNRDQGKDLRVNIGVFQADDQTREINNAFSAAQDANSISANTVWGITFTNEYVTDTGSANKVLDMLKSNKARAQQLGLKLGARMHVCGLIDDNNSDLGRIFKDIIRNSDFVYCNVYASVEHGKLGAAEAARQVGYYLNGLRGSFLAVNSGIDFRVGETGWPSQDKSFNETPNSRDNLVAYWQGMNDYARNSGIQIQMFQAIDEPWKSQNTQFTAEGHYGWFEKVNGDRGNHQYREKETQQIFQ